MRRRKTWLLAGGAGLAVLLLLCVVYARFSRSLPDLYPQLTTLEGEAVSVGYWPRSSVRPLYDPLHPDSTAAGDGPITLSVPARELSALFDGAKARPDVFRRTYDYVACGEFFFTIPDASGGGLLVILSPGGRVCCAEYASEAGSTSPAVERVRYYAASEAIYDALNAYLTDYIRGA